MDTTTNISATNPNKDQFLKNAISKAGLYSAGGMGFGFGQKTPASDPYASTATTPAPAVPTPTPTEPKAETKPTPEAPKKTSADIAFEEYLNSLKATPGDVAAQNLLDEQIKQSRLDQERALASGETLGFATGEAARVARQNAILQDATSANIKARAELAANRQNISKARYEYEKSKLDKADKELADKKESYFELSPGQTRYAYDPVTGTTKQLASLPSTPKAVADVKGTTRSGGLVYTPSMATEDTQLLESTRDADGYVDPGTYQELYQAWIDNGGLLKDFLIKFPPDKYVNPEDEDLPSYLKPKPKSGEIVNIFR